MMDSSVPEHRLTSLQRARPRAATVVTILVKRGVDLIVAGSFLLVGLPLFALIALLIAIEDRGPIFYYQERVGRNRKTFRFYKFRSMVTNADALKQQLAPHNEADGPIFKMKDDPRVTRIGKLLRRTSLDELPQFWNVLRGDMSLVGPRPHLPCEIADYPDYPLERLSVLPGLICLREVTGRSNLTFERWLELDMEYVQNRSLTLDFKILLLAIPAVLRGDGAF